MYLEEVAAAAPLGSWLIPLIVAVVGLLGGVIGATIGASSSLRLRLIDIVQEDNRAHHKFHVRAVEAVNELGLATHHMLNRRIGYLKACLARTKVSTGSEQVVLNRLEISPEEDLRVKSATERWRGVLAEAQVFAKPGTIAAFEEFDRQRSTVISLTDGAWRIPELAEVLQELERAQVECGVLTEHYSRQVYRELQVSKAIGTVAVFDLAQQWWLRLVAKKIVKATSKQITTGQKLIMEANESKRGRADPSSEN